MGVNLQVRVSEDTAAAFRSLARRWRLTLGEELEYLMGLAHKEKQRGKARQHGYDSAMAGMLPSESPYKDPDLRREWFIEWASATYDNYLFTERHDEPKQATGGKVLARLLDYKRGAE